MNVKLSRVANSHNNNFNLIRFLLALSVVFSHSFYLVLGDEKGGDFEPLKHLIDISFGELAVNVFFILSGFLIAKSFILKPNLKSYIKSRFLRIYPALISAVLFTAFGVGLSFSQLSVSDYLTSREVYAYVWRCTTLLNIKAMIYSLPGVFVHNPYPEIVNGSLWTLPWELWFYIVIGCLGVTKLLNQRQIMNTLTISIYLAYVVLSIGDFSLSPYVLIGFRLSSLFFCGVSVYLNKERISLSYTGLIISICLMLAGSYFHQAWLLPPVLSYGSFVLIYLPAGAIRSFSKIGDYSYGIYIYSYPIQQAVVHSLKNESPYNHFVLSLGLILPISILSWHVVEKPILRLKKYNFTSSLRTIISG